MALLASAVVLVIGNTLRLAMHNRHEEIQILKLIGATDPYIARPFLYSGIWYTLGGAILAYFICEYIYVKPLALAVKQLASSLSNALPYHRFNRKAGLFDSCYFNFFRVVRCKIVS